MGKYYIFSRSCSISRGGDAGLARHPQGAGLCHRSHVPRDLQAVADFGGFPPASICDRSVERAAPSEPLFWRVANNHVVFLVAQLHWLTADAVVVVSKDKEGDSVERYTDRWRQG